MDLSETTLNPDEIHHLRRHLSIPPDGLSFVDDYRPASLPVRIVPPYDHTYSFRVKDSEAGTSLLELMYNRFPFRPVEDWERRIGSGIVLLNGNSQKAGAIVSKNDIIYHRNIGVVEPSVPDEISIVRKYDDLLVIDKPSPLPMHAGGRYNRNTVVNILDELGFGPLHIVHRLDAVTSGLLILGRTIEFARLFSRAMSDGGIRKKYEAIVRGVPAEDAITIDRGIKRDRGFVFKCSDDHDAKEATTRFKVLYRGAGWSHVACEPITGRTHQIRLHLAEWGYPIWDDSVYNGKVVPSAANSLIQNRGISLVSMGMELL